MSILLTNQVQSLAGKKILGITGSILQVVSTTITSTFTTTSIISTSGGGAAVTGLSAAITPTSSTNKILVTVTLNIMGQAGATQAFAYIARGTTPIGTGLAEGSRPGIGGRYYLNDSNVSGMIWMQFLDSPATTNGLTYNVYVGTENASYTTYVNRTQSDGNQLNGARGSSTITVMEIVARVQ
jgi:hypothetical protein